jgi:hypothetical protein
LQDSQNPDSEKSFVKPVGADVLLRVSAALDEMEDRPTTRPTKREVERISGLSHDAVARAFRQDMVATTPFRLTHRLQKLREDTAQPKGVSNADSDDSDDAAEATELRKQMRELNHVNEMFAIALFAHYLEEYDPKSTIDMSNVIPIGKNRRRRRPG